MSGTEKLLLLSVFLCFNESIEMVLSLSLCLSQRVLEADAAEDAFNDDDDYEVDTPKRRHRGKGRVSAHITQVVMNSHCFTVSLGPTGGLKIIALSHSFFIKNYINISLIDSYSTHFIPKYHHFKI